MFKEISTELLSILSDDSIEKIAHMPTNELAKTLELLFDVDFSNVERIYSEQCNNYTRHTVVYKSDKNIIQTNTCLVNGTVRHIICMPSSALNKNESNAIIVCKAIIKYISLRIYLISSDYKDTFEKNTIADKTCMLSIPVIACDAMRKLYSGASLPTIIYNTLIECLPIYKNIISLEGIESVFDLFDEGLSIETLLDYSFIYAVKDDPKYPGILEVKKE